MYHAPDGTAASCVLDNRTHSLALSIQASLTLSPIMMSFDSDLKLIVLDHYTCSAGTVHSVTGIAIYSVCS